MMVQNENEDREVDVTKAFHFSDVLSITTGRLVSTRHIEGVYDILNWMTQDDLFTHQLPRAMRECSPALVALYPELSEESLTKELEELSVEMNDGDSRGDREAKLVKWLDAVFSKTSSALPYHANKCLPVMKLKGGQHLHIDPIE